MKIKFIFAWFDFWIGIYWDRKSKILYMFPVPCIGFVISFTHQPYGLSDGTWNQTVDIFTASKTGFYEIGNSTESLQLRAQLIRGDTVDFRLGTIRCTTTETRKAERSEND